MFAQLFGNPRDNSREVAGESPWGSPGIFFAKSRGPILTPPPARPRARPNSTRPTDPTRLRIGFATMIPPASRSGPPSEARRPFVVPSPPSSQGGKGMVQRRPPGVRNRSLHPDPPRAAYCDLRKSWSRGGPHFSPKNTIFLARDNRGTFWNMCMGIR